MNRDDAALLASVKSAVEAKKERERQKSEFRSNCREAWEVVMWMYDFRDLVTAKDATALGTRFLRALELGRPTEWEKEEFDPPPPPSDDELERRYFDKHCR